MKRKDNSCKHVHLDWSTYESGRCLYSGGLCHFQETFCKDCEQYVIVCDCGRMNGEHDDSIARRLQPKDSHVTARQASELKFQKHWADKWKEYQPVVTATSQKDLGEERPKQKWRKAGEA
jgi:hypothetical protein